MQRDRTIGVIGLGYVGLPVAASFGAAGWPVIGFDIDARRIGELHKGHDRTGEVSAAALGSASMHFTDDASELKRADFFIVTVPTPIDDANRPDLTPLRRASETVGKALRPGAIVVYESTVYPGATEEECIPILEALSSLKAGKDFFVGYSPERINPGDQAHRFETILKVVSAQTPESLKIVAEVYGSVVTAGVHKASSIRVAEAAKVIENTQRDLNIAFVNELAKLFKTLDLDTKEVLEAAGTKWNFMRFHPGLVGGHCIGVDPFYLTYRAERAGYHPEVILAGRRINDSMGAFVAQECVRLLLQREPSGRKVTVLGITFKEDVPDIRNSKVVDIIRELQRFRMEVQVADPMADAQEVQHEFGIDLVPFEALAPADALVLAVPHKAFRAGGWPMLREKMRGTGVLLDVKSVLDRASVPGEVAFWRL